MATGAKNGVGIFSIFTQPVLLQNKGSNHGSNMNFVNHALFAVSRIREESLLNSVTYVDYFKRLELLHFVTV